MSKHFRCYMVRLLATTNFTLAFLYTSIYTNLWDVLFLVGCARVLFSPCSNEAKIKAIKIKKEKNQHARERKLKSINVKTYKIVTLKGVV